MSRLVVHQHESAGREQDSIQDPVAGHGRASMQLFRVAALLVRFGCVLALLALIGCSSAPAAVPTPAPTSVSAPLPTANATAAATAVSTAEPTRMATVSATPVLSPVPTIKTTPTRTSTITAGMMRVKLYFVAVNDNGAAGKKIGCNDSLVAVDREIPATNAPLTAALNALFSLTDKDYGQSGLYNALYQSKLKLDSAAVVNAKATINLSGSLTQGGVCDSPRIQAQIEQVALQFSTVKSVAVFLNGKSLEQALSEK